MCGERNKPSDRNYICKECGFKFHRDFVGSLGIERNFYVLKLKKGIKLMKLFKGRKKFKLTVFKVDIKKHEVVRKENYIGVGIKPSRRGDRHAPPPTKGGDSSPSL